MGREGSALAAPWMAVACMGPGSALGASLVTAVVTKAGTRCSAVEPCGPRARACERQTPPPPALLGILARTRRGELSGSPRELGGQAGTRVTLTSCCARWWVQIMARRSPGSAGGGEGVTRVNKRGGAGDSRAPRQRLGGGH